jgi:radical SAM superfamily enzyme YgiQ (UPF0313 family)
MKCVLIIPAWTPEEIFSTKTAGSQINYWQPLGTLYVGACLLEAGHEVEFIDGSFLTHEAILRRVGALKPDFAGIYSTAFGWPGAMTTAADIKALDPGIWTCVGGPYPTAAREACLGDGCEGIDAVVVGEGEETVVEILDRLRSGKDPTDVTGTIARKDGGIVRNPPRPLIADLDRLPIPARALLGDRSRYIPAPATYRKNPWPSSLPRGDATGAVSSVSRWTRKERAAPAVSAIVASITCWKRSSCVCARVTAK